MNGRAAAERLKELLRARDLLSLECAALAREVDDAGYAKACGSETTVDWIRHECRVSYGAAAELVCVGSQLERVPEAVEAVERGEIGFGHLVHIARAQRGAGETPIGEAALVEQARRVSVSRFWYVCQAARHAASPAVAGEEHREQFERRALRVSRQPDGMVSLSGVLDGAGGELVRATLRRLAARSGSDDMRTRDQRTADALVELVRKKTRTHVHVTATLGTVLHVSHPEPGDLAGGLLPAATVQKMVCDGSVGRMLFSSDSILVDAGRERRVVSEPTRRALIARDRRCRWPGCEKPGSWCEAHHVIPWAHGGATNLDNLVLLCSYHHTLVHEGNWQLALHPDGHLEPLRPPPGFRAPPRAA